MVVCRHGGLPEDGNRQSSVRVLFDRSVRLLEKSKKLANWSGRLEEKLYSKEKQLVTW
jgi:hypothetical protein